MRLHQKTITIRLPPDLSNQLFNQLQASTGSEEQTLRELLQLGLNVKQGNYHDAELAGVESRQDESIRLLNLVSTQLKNLNIGVADLQDAYTNQTFKE